MILEIDFPPDDRPEKEALSLIEAGYEVFLLCFTWSNKPLSENYKNINISRFKINRQIFKKLSAVHLILPFYGRIWKKHIEKFVTDNRINILHVHDLPLTSIARSVAEKYGCKLVFDQHEYWSNWVVNTAHYNTPVGKIVKAMSNWKKYEKRNLQNADLVITVSEPLRKCYIRDVEIDEDKIITVPNTPSRKIFENSRIDETIIQRYSNNFVLFYAGAIDILRGIDLIINSLPELEKIIPNIKFVIAGRIARSSDPILMAREKKVEHLVDFLGWLDISALPSYLKAADICVFTPHPASDEIENTIATKIYQYLIAGRPIITSQVKMMRDFVVNNKLGFSVDSKSKEEFIDAVKTIFNNYENISGEVKKNRDLLLSQKNIFWDQTTQIMIDRYKQLSEMQ